MDYSNILNAINGPKLTPSQISENYKAFDEIQKQGVFLPDLLKRIEDLEQKVKTVPTVPDITSEVFSVMESAVKDDESVKALRRRAQDIKAQIITEMCIKDPRYKSVLDEYRATVNRVYVASREEKKEDSPSL